MQERIEDSLVSRRSPMLLSISFGLTALLLAAVGIYGVLACTVAQRTKEIGVRMALGSSPRGILRLVLRVGAWITSLGVAAGLCGAVALAKYIEGVLYGIRPLDPAVMASVAAGLLAIALGACLMPARRAARVNPIRALRHE